MMSVQKRKSTCPSAIVSSNGQLGGKKSANNSSSRKRTKVAATSGSSRVNSSQQMGTINAPQPQYPQYPQQQQQQVNDESVWIFGLINNIEQLLSTFSAINSSSSTASPATNAAGAKHLGSSGSSSPGSAPSPGSSSASQSSTMSASPAHATSSLPHSPVSRQIKFHEYKGPPSAKRQPVAAGAQQVESQAQHPNQNQSQQSRQLITSSMLPISASGGNLVQAGQVHNTMPLTGGGAAAAAGGDESGELLAAEGVEHSEVCSMRQHAAICNSSAVFLSQSTRRNFASQSQHMTSSQTTSRRQQQNELLRAATVASQQNVLSSPSSAVQKHQLEPNAFLMQQNAGQLTSGPHGSLTPDTRGLQTFYINQNTLGASDGKTLLLAPSAFVESPSKHNVQEYNHHSPPPSHPPPHPHPQLPHHHKLEQPTSRLQDHRTVQSSYRPAQLQHHLQQQQQQQQQILSRPQQTLHQRQSCSSTIAVRPVVQDQLVTNQNQHNHNHNQQQLNNELSYRTDCNYTAYQPLPSISQLDQRSQQLAFGSADSSCTVADTLQRDYLDLQNQFDQDLVTTDACDLEPSIGFSPADGSMDELLFSEFIDLQDVPMNVDESDWLKKFLPPCSMS